jgi:hypothetical protein
VADPRCGPVLITLLDGEDPPVREWATMTFAELHIDGAVEPLRRACPKPRTLPDWAEPGGIRRALTELGARTPVVPPLTAHLGATAVN